MVLKRSETTALQVQFNQRTNSASRVFAQALMSLGIKHVTSSLYHPESQRALSPNSETIITKALL